MATSSGSRSSRAGRGERAAGYIQPGRVGKKPLVGYFSSDAHKAIKQLSLDLDRSIEALMGEAFHDLLAKHRRQDKAQLFND